METPSIDDCCNVVANCTELMDCSERGFGDRGNYWKWAGSPPTRSKLAAGLQCADCLAALAEKVRDSGLCAEFTLKSIQLFVVISVTWVPLLKLTGFCRCAEKVAKMVQPLTKVKKVRKYGNKKFNRHQHDRKIAVKVDIDAPCSLTLTSERFLSVLGS